MRFPYIIGLLLLALSTSNCAKLVEVNKPYNTITDIDVFTTNEQANGAIAGLYSRLMSNNGTQVFSNGGATLYGGLSADELVNQLGAGNVNDYAFVSNKLTKESTIPNTVFWTPAYQLIYAANAIIAGIASSPSAALDAATRKQLTGEAKFVRAFCYFYLTNVFGDVPLALSVDFNETRLLPKASQDKVYDQVVQDLKEAQDALAPDYSVTAGERIRPNKWAATALLARVYLYRKDWQNAEIQATAVIGESQYGLLATLKDVFLKNSKEAIWQLKQNTTVKPYGGTWDAANFIPSIIYATTLPANQALYTSAAFYPSLRILFFPSYYLTPAFVSMLKTNDKRRTNWTNYIPSPAAAPWYGVQDLYPYKHSDVASSTTTTATQYYMVLRLGEQYLIRAEARAQRQNADGAREDLDAIRLRAGLENTKAVSPVQLLDSIAAERRLELFAEWGHRWFDLKRTGKATAVLGAIPEKQPWNDDQLLYPIPPTDIISNPNLVQNHGY